MEAPSREYSVGSQGASTSAALHEPTTPQRQTRTEQDLIAQLPPAQGKVRLTVEEGGRLDMVCSCCGLSRRCA